MRIAITLLAAFFCSTGWSQPLQQTYVNHAWVDGVYWNQDALPGWGFFVDMQEETLFGAIYGYTGSGGPTFITLQGNLISNSPLTFQGNVFSVTNNGTVASDVGNFTWEVGVYQASPAATLDITSNILSRSNLALARFSYVEDDKVDMFTAGNWDIITRILGISFGESYGISDERYVDGGITYAVVIDNAEPDKMGLVGYFPPADGDLFAMLVQFDENTNEFFMFYASDTEMFGRNWLLDDGEDPTGNGYYFHASADTYQLAFQDQPLSESTGNILAGRNGVNNLEGADNGRTLRYSLNDISNYAQTPMFPEAQVRSTFERLSNALFKRTKSTAENVQ